MNSSKVKAGQVSESRKSYESILILRVQNEKNFESNIITSNIFYVF